MFPVLNCAVFYLFCSIVSRLVNIKYDSVTKHVVGHIYVYTRIYDQLPSCDTIWHNAKVVF